MEPASSKSRLSGACGGGAAKHAQPLGEYWASASSCSCFLRGSRIYLFDLFLLFFLGGGPVKSNAKGAPPLFWGAPGPGTGVFFFY